MRGLLFALAFAGFVAPANAQDIVTVAIGGQGSLESSPAEIGEAQGFFRKHGVKAVATYTAGSGESMQALIGGAFDVAAGIGTASAMGAYAKGAPLRVIGAAMTGANDTFWYVKADSPIRTIQDMAGKTVGYSTAGSSSQAVVLGLRDYFKVDLKPTATGSPQATFTQVMSNQVDVGWSSGPTFLEAVEDGRTRIIARGSDLPYLQTQTPRLLVTNVKNFTERRDVLVRFMRGYRETIEWLYTAPEAIGVFSKWSGFPEKIAIKARDEIYKDRAIDCDRIIGLDAAMEDGIKFKFLAAPLTKEQMAELFHAPFLK
jgi:NitT/TauT family transport system substrate-binding protein